LNNHNYGIAAGGANITASMPTDPTENVNVNVNASGVITVTDENKKYAEVNLRLTKDGTFVDTRVRVMIP
jgi:cytoskeletal protein RodZ